MTTPKFVDGRVSSPFAILIRASGRLTDMQLLARLGLYEYRPNDDPDASGIWLTEIGEWLQVLDNGRYDLWNRPDIRERIDSLGWKYDVFAYSVGDTDLSYDFELHWERALARRRVVRCPDHPETQVVATDIGKPLPVEAELAGALATQDALPLLHRIVASLGLPLAGPDAVLRRYAPARLQVLGQAR